MTVEYLAFPTDEFPCFGFAVCEENGKFFLPEYDENDTVDRFAEMAFEAMYLYRWERDHEINIGDTIAYVYMCDKGNYIFGTMEQIRPLLMDAICKINDAPFSKLELAEFLDINGSDLEIIQDECYNFLYTIDTKQAKIWALENAYITADQCAIERDILTPEIMQDFAQRIYAFTVHSEKVIDDYKTAHSGCVSSNKKVEYLQVFLQTLCRSINQAFFDSDGARTHFRYLHSEKNEYLKLAAAHDDYDYCYGMTPIPATGKGMIFRASLYEKPLIWSSYSEFHYGRSVADAQFKDYITFVLIDTNLKYKEKYLLSMGISSTDPDRHMRLFHLFRLYRLDNIIVKVIKSYEKATNVNVVSTIVDNKDYIWKRFEDAFLAAAEKEAPHKVPVTSADGLDYEMPATNYDKNENKIAKFYLEQALFEFPFLKPESIYCTSIKRVNGFLNQITDEEIHLIEYDRFVKPPKEVSQCLVPASV